MSLTAHSAIKFTQRIQDLVLRHRTLSLVHEATKQPDIMSEVLSTVRDYVCVGAALWLGLLKLDYQSFVRQQRSLKSRPTLSYSMRSRILRTVQDLILATQSA